MAYIVIQYTHYKKQMIELVYRRDCELFKDINKRWKSLRGSGWPHNAYLALFSWRNALCLISIAVSSITLSMALSFSVEEKRRGWLGIRSDSLIPKTLRWLPLYLGGMISKWEHAISLLSTTHTSPSKKVIWLEWDAWRADVTAMCQATLSTLTRQALVCSPIVNHSHTCFQWSSLVYCSRDLGSRSPLHLINTHCSCSLAVIVYALKVIICRQKWDIFGTNHSNGWWVCWMNVLTQWQLSFEAFRNESPVRWFYHSRMHLLPLSHKPFYPSNLYLKVHISLLNWLKNVIYYTHNRTLPCGKGKHAVLSSPFDNQQHCGNVK